MGLTHQNCGSLAFNPALITLGRQTNQKVIALAGNPNTGKSTVFNALTGLRQHTGNWPGKTVTNAQGHFIHKGQKFLLVDLPGTYSLLANSTDEEVARDFLCFGRPDATIVVTDATCLERNLNLALQVLEITDRVVVCVNLMDEAERKGIQVDCGKLALELGVPVIPTAAREGIGLDCLLDLVHDIANQRIDTTPYRVKYDTDVEGAIARLEPRLREVFGDDLNSRWVALRLLDGDQSIINLLAETLS